MEGGCAGGAEGRSKGLICPLRTWMEDRGGKSARRPARHLQVEASGPGTASSVQLGLTVDGEPETRSSRAGRSEHRQMAALATYPW